jgi:hypothetical protein
MAAEATLGARPMTNANRRCEKAPSSPKPLPAVRAVDVAQFIFRSSSEAACGDRPARLALSRKLVVPVEGYAFVVNLGKVVIAFGRRVWRAAILMSPATILRAASALPYARRASNSLREMIRYVRWRFLHRPAGHSFGIPRRFSTGQHLPCFRHAGMLLLQMICNCD